MEGTGSAGAGAPPAGGGSQGGQAGGSEGANTRGGGQGAGGGESNKDGGRKADSGSGHKAPEIKPKPKAPQFKRIVVDGEVRHVNADELERNYSKYESADRRLREASEHEARLKQRDEEYFSDPLKLLRDPRIPAEKRREIALSLLEEDITSQINPPDPRDLENKKLKDQLKEFEDRDRKAKEEKDQKDRNDFKESRKTEISQTIKDALEMSPLSKDPQLAGPAMRTMAGYMRMCREQGIEVSAEDLANHVHNEAFRQMYIVADRFDGDELIEALGENVVNKIRKADIARIRKTLEIPAETHRSSSGFPGQQRKDPVYIDPSDEKIAMRSMR